MKKCPETKLLKAEEIAQQYKQLSNCCDVISLTMNSKKDNSYNSYYKGGWRLWENDITSAGIDIEEVYAHITRLANKRRAELECELVKLET